MTPDEVPDQIPNSPFSPTLPTLQLYWDSMSLGALKKCPRLYKYWIIDGYQLDAPPNDHLTFGLLFHRATEEYAHARNAGKTHDEGVRIALKTAILQSWDFENKKPWTSIEPTKTRKTLLRTIVWYLDNYENDPIETMTLPDGSPAVEVGFRIPLTDDDEDELGDDRFRSLTTGEGYYLCGRLDKIGLWNEKPYIEDRKTTKYQLDDTYFNNYQPDNQMSLYDIAGVIILGTTTYGVIVDAAQVLVNGSRFRRQPIHRYTEQREDWLNDLAMWLHMAETYAVTNQWPQNENGCGFGYNRCQFWKVCSSNPSVRQDLLDSQYTKTRGWNPLERRDDG